MDREIAPEDEVPAVFNLVEGVVASQVDRCSLLFGELRTQHQRPVIQALADGVSVELVGCGLQGLHIGGPQKGIVVFAEPNALPLEFTLDEVMAVDVVRRLKGKKRADAQDHRAKHFIPNIEVKVSKP